MGALQASAFLLRPSCLQHSGCLTHAPSTSEKQAHLGMIVITKMDEFMEKVQMAVDAPPLPLFQFFVNSL